MRSLLLGSVCVVLVGLSAALSAYPEADSVIVRIRLLDADNGQGLAGLVRVFPKNENQPLVLPCLFDRLKGLQRSETVAGWYVVPPEGGLTTLPRKALRLKALAGLETALVRQNLDLREQVPAEVTLKLPFLFRPERESLAASNTHLHLRKLTKAEADDYLRQVPAVDDLKVLFLSYLERHWADRDYITNQYPLGNPQLVSLGVLLHNGEEHRHNFGASGQGYGHVMLLNIQTLVKLVSLGPGITGDGFDDRTLAPGIADARRQGGTILWCHNALGYEGLPRALAGQLDALNVFDGGGFGKYEERYYRLLNIGLRLPISTGTDWVVYDFSRAYAKVPLPSTIPRWLAAVKAGHCVVTNGPVLSLTVAGEEPGAVLALPQPRTIRIKATAVGRHDFRQLPLVRNGQVIKTQGAESKVRAFRAQLSQEVRIGEASWFAVHIEARSRNELGQPLFAHSAPVYIDLEGRRVFDVSEAQKSMARARPVFELYGAGERLGHAIFKSPHAYNQPMREAMYGWMTRWLKKESVGQLIAERAYTLEVPEALRCYPGPDDRPKGFWFPPSLAARTPRALRAEIEEHRPDHVEAWESMAVYWRSQIVEKLFGNFPPLPKPDAKSGQAVTLGEVATTPVLLHPEPEMPLPVLLKSRRKDPDLRPVCVLLHMDGKAAALQHPLVPALLEKSWLVASPDLRATGRPQRTPFRDGRHQTSGPHRPGCRRAARTQDPQCAGPGYAHYLGDGGSVWSWHVHGAAGPGFVRLRRCPAPGSPSCPAPVDRGRRRHAAVEHAYRAAVARGVCFHHESLSAV